MEFDDCEGYWFSTDDGTHIFARYGQSKLDAINEFNDYHKDYFYRDNQIIKYNNVKDMIDSKIFKFYFSRLRLGKTKFSPNEKKYFVSILKSIYDKVILNDLNYYLIPDDSDYLNDTLIKIDIASPKIQIDYKWPPNQGFSSTPHQIMLEKGSIFDRYGNPYGTFVSPIYNDKSYSIKERALPYYIPDSKKNVLYHRYEVIKDFSQIKSIIETFYDSKLTPTENKIARTIYLKEYESFTIKHESYIQRPGYANIGEIARAFGGGGGIQIELPLSISTLLSLKIIKEV